MKTKAEGRSEKAEPIKRPNMRKMIEEGSERARQLNQLGMTVNVMKDDGEMVESTITHLPWQLGHGQWVIGVQGFSGGYDILRVVIPLKV